MTDYHRPDARMLQELKDIANKLRIHSIRATNASKSGHPTSCCSMAEIMSVLFFKVMRYTIEEVRNAANDRFILSKGHAAPVLYAAWAEAGVIPIEELTNLRKIDSELEGHPTPRQSYIDVATGSLGQGLSVAAGMAYTGKYIDQSDYRTYCLIGDGESAEGSIWEAMSFSSKYKLDNLVAIFDVNRLGQSEATAHGHDIEVYRKRAEAFGWHTVVVDGHDVEALAKAFHEATTVKQMPTCIIAKTFKGKGIPGIEDQDNWHGKPMGVKAEAAIEAITALISNPGPHTMKPPCPTCSPPDISLANIRLSEAPGYKLGQEVATRAAYGTALVKLNKNNDRVIGMDGDTKNSTFAINLRDANPSRFIECFIAEQNMVGIAMGCACRDRTVAFVSTFAAFLCRAFDHIRMGAVSMTNVNFVGSHCGVSIGEDGPSQMALEDLAMFRTIPGSTVFYPSDAVSCERAAELAANTKGICFIRTSRPAIPVLYSNEEVFEIGKAKVVRESDSDKVTVIGSCVTLNEALRAADTLATEGINIRVLDPFTIKPLDEDLVRKSVEATGGRVVVVEDHYPEGGIGEAVMAALSQPGSVKWNLKHLAVRGVPRSGKPAELLHLFGIDADCIVKAVKSFH